MPRIDPTDPTSFNHRFVLTASGNRYHLVDQPPTNWIGDTRDAPTLILFHGFPDLWYGWRYQIHEFASRGYRVLVPSHLGYGETDSPIDVRKYSFKSICYDMNSLLDQVGAKRVSIFAHDWGGMIGWRFCNYFPDRIVAIASVCTPYQAPATVGMKPVDDAVLIRNYLPQFGYQLYFASPSAATELDEVIDLFLQPMFSATFRRAKDSPQELQMSHWVLEGRLQSSIQKQIEARRQGKIAKRVPQEKELDFYIETYRKAGIRGALNWYKIRSINFKEEQEANLPPFPSHIPCLQLPAELDAALPPSMCLAPSVLKCFPGGNLEVKVVKGDHWCLQDEKTRSNLNHILGEWIQKVYDGKWKPSGNVRL